LAFFLEKAALKFKYSVFIVVVIFGVMSIQRNRLWANEYTLMTHDIQHLSGSAQANNLAGIACMKKYSEYADLTREEKQALLNEAEQYFKKAIKVYPYLFNINYDLGRVQIEKANYSNAEESFNRALQFEPDNELGLEERLRTTYLLKQYSKVLVYLKDFKMESASELVLEIAAHSNLLTEHFNASRQYCKLGLEKYPANNNFKLIWQELALK
jgi:tetratricopeptide (TPR) repeat protein